MSQRIDLNRVVYDKDKYQKTIDTSFNELLPPVIVEEEDTITVEQFFNYYNQLFFDIPKTGINSHNTLIQESTEYVGNEQVNDEINAYIQEINSLREQLLETQTELTGLQQTNAKLATLNT